MLEHRQDKCAVQEGRILDAYYLKMRISSVDGGRGVAAPDGRDHFLHFGGVE